MIPLRNQLADLNSSLLLLLDKSSSKSRFCLKTPALAMLGGCGMDGFLQQGLSAGLMPGPHHSLPAAVSEITRPKNPYSPHQSTAAGVNSLSGHYLQPLGAMGRDLSQVTPGTPPGLGQPQLNYISY